MKRMHFVPSDVRARVCQLIEKRGEELIHLAYGTEYENNTAFFVGIARKCNAETPCCYKVISYNSEKDELWQENENYTYANALIEMGTSIE